MILYNMTFSVEVPIVEDFKNFIQETHIPSLGEDVIEHKFMRLLNTDESENMTLSLQYFLKDMESYNRHIIGTDSLLKRELYKKYGEKVLHFCTVLEKI